MYADRFLVVEDRSLREHDFAEQVAQRNKYARPKRGPSLRARVARRLFELAVATERQKIPTFTNAGKAQTDASKHR